MERKNSPPAQNCISAPRVDLLILALLPASHRFLKIRFKVKKDIASSFRKTIDAAEGVVSKTGASSWSTHTYSLEEREAFADWINTRLKDDPDCKNLLPITVDDESLFEKVSDGILLCKLINLSQPETIDERAINKTKLRN